MMRYIKRLFTYGLIAFGSIIILLAILTSTELGLRLLTKLVPGQLQTTHIKGSLLSGIQLDHLHYQLNTETIKLNLEADQVVLHWRARDLLHRKVTVTKLTVSNSKILLLDQTQQDQTKLNKTKLAKPTAINLSSIKQLQLPSITIPIDITLEQFTIDHAVLIHNQQQQIIKQINFTAKLTQNTLSLSDFVLNTPTLTWHSKAKANLANWQQIHWTNTIDYVLNAKPTPVHLELNISNKNKNNKNNSKQTLTITAHSKTNNLLNAKIYLKNYTQTLNNITISGHWLINTVLENWLPKQQIRGQLELKGEINGSLIKPIINNTFKLTEFNHANTHIDELNTQLVTRITNSIHNQIHWQIHWQLMGKNISFGTHVIKQLSSQLTGTIQQHQFTISAQTASNQALKLQLDGALDIAKQQWHGIINKLAIKLGNNPNWQLEQASHIILGHDMFELRQFCLNNTLGKLCLASNTRDFAINTQLNISRLDLASLDQWLPTDTHIMGNLSAQANSHYNLASKTFSGSWQGNIHQAKISNRITHKIVQQTIEKIQLNGTLNQQGFNTDLSIIFNNKNNNKINFGMHLPDYTGQQLPNKNTHVSAELAIQLSDLAIVRAFTDAFGTIDGSVHSNLAIMGTLGQPVYTGQLNLDNGVFDIIPLGIELAPVNLQIKPIQHSVLNKTTDDKYNYDLAYTLTAGRRSHHQQQTEEQLSITGKTQLNPANLATELNLTTKRFTISNTGSYRIILAADLTAHNVLTDKYQINTSSIQGSATLLKGSHIAPADFSNTVTLPKDVVFVNNAGQAISTSIPTLNLLLQLQLTLEAVKFQYHGLNTVLHGKIDLNKSATGQLNTQGQISTISGAYQAYGQALLVAKDSAIIFNGDASNPSLDIKAYKAVVPAAGDVTLPSYQDKLLVGIHVMGSADKPIITFYSVPTGISQQDILSYIVFGFPQDQLSDSQTAAIWQAFNFLESSDGKSSTANNVRQKLQKSFGLSELGFSNSSAYNPETEEYESGTAFVVGKQLTNKLSITYSMGIMVPINILYLRYRLSNKWALQTDSSALGNGADIFYTIARD